MAYSGVLIPQLAEDPDIKEFTKKQASWIGKNVILSMIMTLVWLQSCVFVS